MKLFAPDQTKKQQRTQHTTTTHDPPSYPIVVIKTRQKPKQLAMFDEKDIIDLLSTDDEDDSNRTINHRCTQSRLVVPVPVQIKGRELVTQSNNIDDDEEDEDEIKVVHICGNSNNDEHRSPKKKHKKRKRALSLDEGDYRESSPWNYESNLSCTNTSSIERGRIHNMFELEK